MPSKPKKPCAYPGCPALVTGRYCEEHARKVNSDYEKYSRDKSTKRRYGRAWKRIRDKYAAEHPFCELCFERGLAVPVEEIHHRLPLSEGGTYDRSNLIALCKSCHSQIHAKREDEVGAIEISTGLSPKERRVGVACAVAKWNMGGNNWLTKVKIGYII